MSSRSFKLFALDQVLLAPMLAVDLLPDVMKCEYVCVRERERERGMGKERERE